MVKGTAKPRSVKEEPPMKPKEVLMRHNSSPARPPLSSFSASARNNLTTSPSQPQSKLDRRTSQVKLPRSISYPHLENTDSNIGSSSSNPSSPEKYSTPSGTPVKAKPKRTRPLNLSDRSSNPGSDEEATTTDYSTSGSEAENSRHGLRRMSLGPKIEAAVTKFNTPCKPLIPLAGRIGTPVASPGSLRAGVQRALVLDHSLAAQPQFDLEENVSFWDDHSVQVVIRTRPISGKEAASQEFSRCLRQDGPRAITWAGQPETRFTFDHVAGENISQEKLFKVVGLPIVENCMAGYNSCMFAYGQTGSGKTHTMLGDITSLGDRPSDNRGMTPRIFEYLFSKIQQEEEDRQLEQLQFVCKCSFLEIYNEQITDLLEPSSSNLQMREDSKKGIYVENLTEIVVSSVQDVVLLLLKGASSRKVASTNMNRESSRSHSVFTCSIESKWETNTLSNMRFGRLNLVDLAGSERQKSSRAEGDRLKEAASINKSLSTLGLVIMALVDIANGKPRHVPYRDSKLTFLLQDSLGGNSKTAIIATISPSSCCSMETLSTLKFAQRAKFIQNNAVINEDASGDVQALQREIQQLKEEVSKLRCQTISSIRRECRRDSNEFFRLSMTGKDLFDAAEKERATEGAELKSEELLEKIKALELVLAGALRREQEADMVTKKLSEELEKANKLVEEREIEVRNCKSLLNLDENADPGNHLIFAEKLEIAGSLEYNSTVTKLDLENQRLTEQLRSYQGFIDAGEKEMMAAEIQGLRDQVLELLDGKIAVERGSLSTTISQDESHIKELETCRNDLTKCLEASSQLQSQVDELQFLVKQLSTQCADKEKEQDLMKTGWESAAANLFHNLVEGERALLEVGHEMDEILGEDWQPKHGPENAVRWSFESVKSLKEVDVEHDYFKGRDSITTDDMFSESKRVSRRKRSSGINPRASFVHEEKMKLEASVARLEQELEDHKQILLENADLKVEVEELSAQLQEQNEVLQAHISELEKLKLDQAVEASEENLKLRHELDSLSQELKDRKQQEKLILEENADLKVEVEKLCAQLQEQKELLQAQISQFEKVKSDQAEDHRQHEKQILEENAALKVEVEKLSAQLQEQKELLQAQISQFEKVKSDQAEDHRQHEKQILEENADLKVEVEKLCAQLQEQNELLQAQTSQFEKVKLDQAVEASEENLKLRHEIDSLSQELKDHKQQEKLILEENADLKVKVEKLCVQLQEQNESLQSDLEKMKSDQAVTAAEENLKLQHEIDALSQELRDGEKTLAALQDMARIKDEENALLRLDSTKISTLEISLQTQQEEMSELETEIERLELSLHEAECRNQSLEETNHETRNEAEMVSQKLALTDTVQEELRATVSSLHIELEKKVKQIQEMDQELESCQVKICEKTENLQKTDGARRQIQELLDVKSFEVEILSDVMEVIATEMRNQFERTLSVELEHEQALTERKSKRKENNLLAEILTLKEELLTTEYNVDVTREGELCLQGELLALSEIVKSINCEKDGVKKEIEALQLEHQSLVDSNQQSIETIALLNETVEDLQTQLQRKEDLLEGLEFDLSMLQEHAADDTDFKQEVLKANIRVSELEMAVRRASEEVNAVNSCKNHLEEQLALKIAAMELLVDRVAVSETEATTATKEIQSLNLRLSRMESSMGLLEAEIAEKNEALISQEQEMAEAREVSSRITSQKSAALLSLQSERDELKSQCSVLVEKVGCLHWQVEEKISELECLHGELLVSKMSECCLEELKTDLEAHVDRLKDEMASLELHVAELEGERNSMKSQLESESALQECASLSLDKMKCQVDDLLSLNCKLETELAVKIDAVCSLEAAGRTQTAENDELRARVAAFEEKHSDLVREFALKEDAMARDMDDMSVRITALVSEKDTLETILSQKDEAMAAMDVELESLKSFNLKLSENKEEIQSATRVLHDEIQALEKEVALKNDALSSMTRDLDEKITTLVSEKDTTLLQRNEAVAAMDVELASLKSKLSELELQKIRDEEILQDEIQALKVELAGSQESHNTLKLQLSENIAALKDEFSSETNDEIQVMKAGIGALLKEKDTLTSEVALKSQLITTLEAELEESTDCISGLEAKATALQSDAQITELELGVISSLKVELTEAQNALKIIDKEMSEAKRAVDDENAALNTQIVNLQMGKGSLEAEISCKSALIMSLEAAEKNLRIELTSFEAQILELQTANTALEAELAEKSTSISELLAQKHDELERATQEMGTMKVQLKQQEVQLSSLEELLARKAEALQHVVDNAVQATQECDGLRAEVESLKDTIRVRNSELEALEEVDSSEEALRRERDQALVEVQNLQAELRAAQALVASHKSSVLEAQKFAEVNILRASGKDEEARTLKASVSALKSQNNELQKELEASKHEAERLRQSCEEFEMELQGMKNRMTMLQAVHSTGSRNFKGFQAAQAASLDLQKRLEDRETEVAQMYKRMTNLHNQNEAQASRLEDMENELAHVHQELDELQSQCEDKDAQLSALNGQLKEAETLTQDVMRDLHNVKLDISNYASLVSQQQLELIAERARHTDEAREKDEELSNLQTQLNQERQNWMVEMNHKQAEIVVARVLSEKMRLKNKTLAAEYKRLKADYGGKKKKLKFLEQQLTQITTETRRFSIGTESEADFDEVQQFQALLAQANDHERAQRKM